jgi:hypothetical protein
MPYEVVVKRKLIYEKLLEKGLIYTNEMLLLAIISDSLWFSSSRLNTTLGIAVWTVSTKSSEALC